MNVLEQLTAEWYEYSGYFVRTNPRARKREKGGWDVELDVLAYSPADNSLIHIETSGDANSWPERRQRFLTKKFILDLNEYEELVGSKVKSVRKIAIVGWSKSTKTDLNWGKEIQVVLIPNFIKQILQTLRIQDPMREVVPEGFPLLRAMQMAIGFGMESITNRST